MSQYCPACGTQIEGDSKFCTTCGYSLANQNNNQNVSSHDINQNFTTYQGVQQYTNGMAIAGLVISIVSLVFCCGSISLIGLVFSIIGLNKAKQNNGVGKGIAIGGLIVNIVGMVLGLLWTLIWLIPFIAVATEVENLAVSVIGLLF